MLPENFTNLRFFVARSRPPLPILLLSLILLILLSLGSGTSRAESSARKVVSASTALPDSLGTIVYQKNPDHPLQVFIIGNSHRSSASGANGVNTVSAQFQTYRIAEWLIRQHQVELLLPEGFFGQQERTRSDAATVRLDDLTLEETLSDASIFVNADLLLHRNYGLALHQVEDRDLYRNARDFLHAGLQSGASQRAAFGLELEYLQERRSAAILQQFPAVIDAAYRQGQIAHPRAILTIGLAHLDEIIKFLATGKAEVAAPPIGTSGFQDYSETLDLLAQQVGVTIIVPRALLANREMRNLAKIEPPASVKKPGVFHPGEI